MSNKIFLLFYRQNSNGRPLQVFPLREYWARWADLMWHTRRIAPGRLVVMSVSMAGCSGLRQAAADFLAKLGSLFAQHLTPSTHWIWVFVMGGRTISEAAVIEGSSDVNIHTTLALSEDPPLHQKTLRGSEQRRWQFCDTEDGMGGLCNEYEPSPLPLPTPPGLRHASKDALQNVPVIVTAGVRHQYLYHSLSTILSAAGVHPNNILVALGDAPKPTRELLGLLGMKYTILPTHGDGNTKLFRYYKKVFQLIVGRFPKAQNVIIIDEDVEVSPDFFSFMSQTMWLLQQEPSLYCINGLGRPQGLAYNSSKVLRGEAQVSWGYAISIAFVQEALNIWLQAPDDLGSHYDFWLYVHVAKGRECIFPEVSRSRHYGTGINTDGFITEKYFLSSPLEKGWGIELPNTKRLRLAAWRQDLSASIKRAKVLEGNPCSRAFLPTPTRPATFVFYVNMNETPDGRPDISDYFPVATCLGGWGLSPVGLHEGVATFTVSFNVTLHVMGVPYSSYAHLRHPHIKPWTLEAAGNEDRRIVEEALAHSSRLAVGNLNLTSGDLMHKLINESLQRGH
ncbi:protein O-linked-mannose beta-1,2-N-acetylglucosaminyltransferase 1-like [Macrobrachium nipponense]|uniref:protein O-linked-mannose beta-1,2-N-acetylglucosaminyltransferase 1-like n=1 Tax=Macrobrachium nipponense TaxID=159736 RepID=UPI0030C7BC85